MPKKSAGILLYRIIASIPEVLLAHPGGPIWKNKDQGAWTIPKGEFDIEEPLQAALREFKEETGLEIDGDFQPLEPVRIKSGKIIYAFFLEKDLDLKHFMSNTFTMEWPIRSKQYQDFPEIDKLKWFTIQEARVKINAGMTPLIDELLLKIR